MGFRKRFRDFGLKRYAKPIAGAFMLTIIFSVSFFVFSSSSTANSSLSITPVVKALSTTTPTLLWNVTTNQDAVFSPVVANGLVYVTSENKFGSPITLFCVNASTGTQIWNITGQFLTFTIANGYVYIGQAIEQFPSAPNPILQGAISCLNAYDGFPVWNNTYGTQLGTPIVGGNIVYVAGTNVTLGLNALTGAQMWIFSAPAGTRFGSLALSGTSLYALSASISGNLSWNSAVYSFDSLSGKELWNYTAPGQFSSLVATDQNVYVSSNFQDTTGLSETFSGNVYQGGVLALDVLNGSRIWQYSINGAVGSPIVVNGTVYTVSSNDNIYAFDASDGRVIWKYASEFSLGSYLLVNGYFFVGSPTGVYCFNAYDGAVIWKFSASDFATSAATSPASGDGVIYVGWSDPGLFSPVTQHNFYALEAANGKELWNYTFGNTVISSPAVADGVVYIDASFVNPLSDELNEGPGALIAIQSNVNSLPLPPLSASEPLPWVLTTTAAIIAVVIALIIISTVIIVFRKRLKTKNTNRRRTSAEPSHIYYLQQFLYCKKQSTSLNRLEI